MGPNNVTKNRLGEFFEELGSHGGSAGNKSLREALGWSKDFYSRVVAQLVEEGRITVGRGQGGSVRVAQPVATEKTKERETYGPISEAIKTTWLQRFGFDSALVSQTHSRGAKDTGGTFTRPDITLIGVRRYIYLPKRLEIVTFEVKPSHGVSVMGVLEAIAHREASHRSYVIYVVSRETFDNSSEVERITELGAKYGIGIIVAEEDGDAETWEVVLDAVRHEPDPARLDKFLIDLPDASIKNQLAKWKE